MHTTQNITSTIVFKTNRCKRLKSEFENSQKKSIKTYRRCHSQTGYIQNFRKHFYLLNGCMRS